MMLIDPSRYRHLLTVHVNPRTGSHTGDGSAMYPVATIELALKLLRQRRLPGQRAQMLLAGGRYELSAPVELGPEDSHTAIRASGAGALPDGTTARPVLDGSVIITNWVEERDSGRRVWRAPLPPGVGPSLLAGDERLPLNRWPRAGRAQIAGQAGLDVAGDFVATLFQGSNSFSVPSADLAAAGVDAGNCQQVVAVVPHYWVAEHLPIARLADQGELTTITSTLRSIFALRNDAHREFAHYYLENVPLAADSPPGVWGMSDSHVWYLPREGEALESTQLRMPVAPGLLQIRGATQIQIQGLEFAYSKADYRAGFAAPMGVREDPLLSREDRYGCDVQAASHVPAAITLRESTHCQIIDCTVRAVDGYAIALEAGSSGNLISGNHLHDLGAGGIKLGDAIYQPDHDHATGLAVATGNQLTENLITRGGRIYAHTVAILATHASYTTIRGNEISDFYYSGISVGWVWGYGTSPSHHNLISDNYIHHLGQGQLNDMGGIYLLGEAPGTEVSGNVITDVRARNYGGWGIYLDEGSSHALVARNLVYDVSHHAFHLHYGRGNVVQDNIFARAGVGLVSITRPEPAGGVAAIFTGNLFLPGKRPIFIGAAPDRDVLAYRITSAANWAWNEGAPVIFAANEIKGDDGRWHLGPDLTQSWLHHHDAGTVLADPQLAGEFGPHFSSTDSWQNLHWNAGVPG